MPIAMLQEMPDGSAEIYDAVNAKMDVEKNPPAGLLFHTAGQAENGSWRIFDVWESREAFDRFSDERLGPAVREVVGDQVQGPPPQAEFYELHSVIKP
jgi:quinol monooxygenase YgiN